CRTRAFLKDNLAAFQTMITDYDFVVGFNNQNFDDRLLAANGLSLPEKIISYDLLIEMWRAAGLGPKLDKGMHTGFSPADATKANIGTAIRSDSALSPIWFQRGQTKTLINS